MKERQGAILEVFYTGADLPDARAEAAIATLAGVGPRLYAGLYRYWNFVWIEHVVLVADLRAIVEAVEGLLRAHGDTLCEIDLWSITRAGEKGVVLLAEHYWPVKLPPGALPDWLA